MDEALATIAGHVEQWIGPLCTTFDAARFLNSWRDVTALLKVPPIEVEDS